VHFKTDIDAIFVFVRIGIRLETVKWDDFQGNGHGNAGGKLVPVNISGEMLKGRLLFL
jgi:hypothetical protein